MLMQPLYTETTSYLAAVFSSSTSPPHGIAASQYTYGTHTVYAQYRACGVRVRSMQRGIQQRKNQTAFSRLRPSSFIPPWWCVLRIVRRTYVYPGTCVCTERPWWSNQGFAYCVQAVLWTWYDSPRYDLQSEIILCLLYIPSILQPVEVKC